MRISILGPVAVLGDDGNPIAVGGARVCALLARLALSAGTPVPAGVLIDTIWAEQVPADPTNALQSLVSRLRRALGSTAIIAQDVGGYLLAVAAEQVDANRFQSLARSGRAQLRNGNAVEAERLLSQALALWRGAAVPELGPAAAAGLSEQRLAAVEDQLSARLQLGQAEDIVLECEALAAAHPLRERFTALLMSALEQAGRPGEALAGYDRLRHFLREELGTDPSPALRQQHLRLLRGATDLPPAHTRRTNLRAARTSFLGRQEQTERINALLEGGRLVTVVGLGGAGKTRLAGVVAGQWVDRLGDGVWLVELAPVTDPVNVAQSILGAMGLRAGTILDHRDLQAQSSDDRLLDGLAGAECLLVLDNCEHLIAAVAELTDRLLAGCPRLRVLATSREPLGIDGEALCQLPPLALPRQDAGVAEAITLPAVRLFRCRSQPGAAALSQLSRLSIGGATPRRALRPGRHCA